MRVVLAIDGSAASNAARDLVASLSWPEATVIRVVAVVEPMSALLVGIVPYDQPHFEEREISASLESRLADAASLLSGPGRVIETRLLRGRPASLIVEEATDVRAGLVVVGSRGLGPIRSMLLGSVSAEVVDHSPCPVLVARGSSIGSILVAVDGSKSARQVVEHLADATYLVGHRLHVLSVGPTPHDVRPYWPLDTTGPVAGSIDDLVTEEHRRSEIHAARAAESLMKDGLDVRWSTSSGDPAHEIIEAARDFGCDLIVMGSRGLTGLDRLLTGSVARNVLLHAPTSVLIVREPIRERQPEQAREPVGQVALSTG